MSNLERMKIVFVGVGGLRQAEWRLQTFTFVPGQPTDVPSELGLRLLQQDAYVAYEEPVVVVEEVEESGEDVASVEAGKSNPADRKAKG